MTREQTIQKIKAEIQSHGGQSATAKKIGVSQARISQGLKQETLPKFLLDMIGVKQVVSYE